MVIEMAYNLMHALKKYSSSSDCRLMLAILEHKLPLESWTDLNEMVDKIKVICHLFLIYIIFFSLHDNMAAIRLS
jgi:hypothetical protein